MLYLLLECIECELSIVIESHQRSRPRESFVYERVVAHLCEIEIHSIFKDGVRRVRKLGDM